MYPIYNLNYKKCLNCGKDTVYPCDDRGFQSSDLMIYSVTHMKCKNCGKEFIIKWIPDENKDGETGLFATPITIPYRTFSQNEEGDIYHHVILHSQEEIDNVRLHFFAAGEDNDEELQIAESNIGNISGNIIRDVHLTEGRLLLRVRFTDNIKHAIKLTAEELYEV